MHDLGSELTYKEGGIMQTRQTKLFGKPPTFSVKLSRQGLFGTALEKGVFADIKRPRDGGKGLAGVVTKDDCYFNPFVELMHKKGGNE